MKLAVLTTDTSHHAYFVREMNGVCKDIRVFQQSTSSQAPFATAHPFEEDRERHEAERWFRGESISIANYAQCLSFDRLNDRRAIDEIAAYGPNLTIVFGTGKLSPEVIRTCHPNRILNLHGGDPESYRGLDTHLWAVYHRDFGSLTTTLHRLDEGLDTGQILDQAVIPLTPGMALHETAGCKHRNDRRTGGADRPQLSPRGPSPFSAAAAAWSLLFVHARGVEGHLRRELLSFHGGAIAGMTAGMSCAA